MYYCKKDKKTNTFIVFVNMIVSSNHLNNQFIESVLKCVH